MEPTPECKRECYVYAGWCELKVACGLLEADIKKLNAEIRWLKGVVSRTESRAFSRHYPLHPPQGWAFEA